VKRDVESHFALPQGRVAVVPLAPANLAYPAPTEEQIQAARARLGLPGSFAFYPARTWPHKNHVGLVEAVALLRTSRSVDVPVVFAGGRDAHAERVLERARSLGVSDLVRFLGHVAPVDLQALYRLARVVVVPSRFEAADALARLWGDAALREVLARRGRESVARFSWQRTARTFRAHYRRLAGWPLDDEDRALLAAPSPL
jgi:glycosyltransferase involved in cell wall biosynthesis